MAEPRGRTKNSDGTGKGGAKAKSKSVDVSRALRSVYDDMLRENVPDEFIDLLGKLD